MTVTVHGLPVRDSATAATAAAEEGAHRLRLARTHAVTVSAASHGSDPVQLQSYDGRVLSLVQK